jgi:hypothetical protein
MPSEPLSEQMFRRRGSIGRMERETFFDRMNRMDRMRKRVKG